MMFSCSIHVVVCVKMSFLFMAVWYFMMLTFVYLSSVGGHLHVSILATMINAAPDMSAGFCVDLCFHFSQVCTQEWNCWVM